MTNDVFHVDTRHAKKVRKSKLMSSKLHERTLKKYLQLIENTSKYPKPSFSTCLGILTLAPRLATP